MLVMDKLLSGRRILVVEDEMLLLMTLEDMLSDLGCESVTAAATVDQALTFADAQVFDIAVLDVNLNGHESYPVADALAARGVPVLFSTGNGNGIMAGYRDRPVLKKPYNHEELVEALILVQRAS
jgi:DNA-binding response OmpR family regulator